MVHNFDSKTLEKIYTLQQGFYISNTTDGKVILSIKPDTALLTSLIKGCPILFTLYRSASNIKLIIEDNKSCPFFFIGKGFSEKSNSYDNFENIVIELVKSEIIRVVYFNEANYQIFCIDLVKKSCYDNFKEWLISSEEQFIIRIQNRDCSDEPKTNYIDTLQNIIWNDNLIDEKPYYNFNEYLKDGKHGYNQEFAIRTTLSNFFTPNEELFYSEKKTNKEELADFLIVYKKAIIIIESKFTISTKQNKFNDAIVKAISQLNEAENIIYDKPEKIQNILIKDSLKELQVCLKICLFNNDGRDLAKAFKNVGASYNKDLLPIFISVSSFNQYLGYSKIQNELHYKQNIIQNLISIRYKFKDKELIVIDGFNSEIGAVTLL